MSQVLFGQSYYLKFDPKLHAAMQPYPPLGALYAAAYLRQRNYPVRVFDAMLAESVNEWDAALADCRPKYAVIYEDNFNYLSKMCLSRMRQAAFEMIRSARAGGSSVILCGSDATDHYAAYLQQGAHFVLLGEGEETLAELLDTLEGRAAGAAGQVRGLAFADDAGQYRTTPRRPDISQLDALPMPARDLVDLGRYREIWVRRHGYFSVNMVTTRGCPYSCNWCAKPIWGQRYHSRSPENVVQELQWLKRHVRPDHVWFADDIFGLKPGWIEEFGRLALQQDAVVPYKCLLRPDLVKPPVVEGLRLSGCRTVWMGAESGSQKILDAMEKGTTVGQIHQACRRLQAAGIEVGFFIQYGYPGESYQDVLATLEMIRKCLPEDIGISLSYPLPGTRFFERVHAQLGEKQNWIDSNDLALMYQGPFPESFYHALYRATHSEFRLRRALKRISQDARQPRRWGRQQVRCLLTAGRNALRWPIDRLGMKWESRNTSRGPENS